MLRKCYEKFDPGNSSKSCALHNKLRHRWPFMHSWCHIWQDDFANIGINYMIIEMSFFYPAFLAYTMTPLQKTSHDNLAHVILFSLHLMAAVKQLFYCHARKVINTTAFTTD